MKTSIPRISKVTPKDKKLAVLLQKSKTPVQEDLDTFAKYLVSWKELDSFVVIGMDKERTAHIRWNSNNMPPECLPNFVEEALRSTIVNGVSE
jgi:hypothetical protein